MNTVHPIYAQVIIVTAWQLSKILDVICVQATYGEKLVAKSQSLYNIAMLTTNWPYELQTAGSIDQDIVINSPMVLCIAIKALPEKGRNPCKGPNTSTQIFDIYFHSEQRIYFCAAFAERIHEYW